LNSHKIELASLDETVERKNSNWAKEPNSVTETFEARNRTVIV